MGDIREFWLALSLLAVGALGSWLLISISPMAEWLRLIKLLLVVIGAFTFFFLFIFGWHWTLRFFETRRRQNYDNDKRE